VQPLVSCVLVTKDRPAFCRQALRCFAAQDYPHKELVVVDDGVEPVDRLCAGVAHVKYIRLTERTPTGTKLNIGIEAARGNLLQKLDDDDYYAPAFLSAAVTRLRRARESKPIVVWCCFAVLVAGEKQLYFSGHGWKTGGTLCFRRSLWKTTRFRNLYASSDSWFIRDSGASIVRVCASDQYVVVRHGANTWNAIKGYASAEAYFRLRPYPKRIRAIVGARNARFYQALMAAER